MNIEKRLYQWDTGQKLVGCTGLYVDFPIDNEVYRVETTDGMCIIPDELLQTSGAHKVYECMTNNTIRSFAFSVTPRPKPPDYVYTPTERLTFEGLVQKVDDAVADMIRRAESGEFDGHTPVKGTDYFTTAEIQQIQNEVSSGAIGEFKSAVDTETDKFNANATEKVNAYNQNDSEKTASYNTNATEKLNAYNSNAESKLNAYNANANNKVAEFDSHTGQIQTDISELKSDLSNSYISFPFDYDGAIEDGIILIKNGISIYNQGKHGTYDVSNIVGKTVFITGCSNNAGDDQKAYVLYGFYDTNGTLLSHHKSVSNTYYNDIEVSVPLNATTLIVNGLDSGSGQPNVKLDTIVKPSMPIVWKLNNDCLTVITKYKYSPDFLSDLAIYEFGKRGVNNLPDFRFITLAGQKIFENSTDWHAPYIIGAINDIDGDDISNYTFTGGNHGYNNTGSMYTTPTARNIELKYYADGKELSNGSSGVASNISIFWVNRVQGYNTRKSDGSGREILEERHTLTFNGKEWESTVEIMPLEDIRIETYYGFQCVVTKLPNIYMIGANYRQPFVITDPHSSGNNTPNKYVAYSSAHRLEMEIDRSYDLGTGIFYGDSGTDGFRTISSGKGYAYLISSRAVSANAIYGARAFYRFMPND